VAAPWSLPTRATACAAIAPTDSQASNDPSSAHFISASLVVAFLDLNHAVLELPPRALECAADRQQRSIDHPVRAARRRRAGVVNGTSAITTLVENTCNLTRYGMDSRYRNSGWREATERRYGASVTADHATAQR